MKQRLKFLNDKIKSRLSASERKYLQGYSKTIIEIFSKPGPNIANMCRCI